MFEDASRPAAGANGDDFPGALSPSGQGSNPTRSHKHQASQNHTSQALPPAVAARLPGLQRLPELTLDEVAHAQECYSALLGEQKECISSPFELRVLLGQLGLYPSEDEIELVVQAARKRVNFTALTHYLRFCKREFEIAEASSEHQQRSLNGGNSHNNAGGAAAVAQLAFSSGGSSRGPMTEESDTLSAFVALGGNEDGSGEVSTALLADVVRNFQLTIDMTGMIHSIDVNRSGMLDYGEFCRLWAIPDESTRRHSLSAFGNDSASFFLSGGGGASTAHGDNNNNNNASSWNAMTTSHRQMLTSLGGTPGSRNNSIGQVLLSQQQRRSFLAQGRRRSSVMHSPVFGCTPALSTTTTAALPYGKSQRLGGNQSCNNHSNSSSAAFQPLSDEERRQLLRMYLMPEPQEQTTRKARLAIPSGGGGLDEGAFTGGSLAGAGVGGMSGGGGGGGTRLPALHGADKSRSSRARPSTLSRPRGSSKWAGKGRTRPAAGAGAEDANHRNDTEDFFSLQKAGTGVYQPPSPMILFQRNRTTKRVTRVDKESANGKTATASRGRGGTYAAHASIGGSPAAATTPQHQRGHPNRKTETF